MDSNKSNCQTISRYDEHKGPIYKNKAKYKTHDRAVEVCKILNSKENQIHKLITYKCGICHEYHIGRNGKEISDKYRRKLRMETGVTYRPILTEMNLKIVGKIDLSQFE